MSIVRNLGIFRFFYISAISRREGESVCERIAVYIYSVIFSSFAISLSLIVANIS